MSSLDWSGIRARLHDFFRYLPHFLKNPIWAMRAVPDWDWPQAIAVEIVVGGITSILSGFVARSLLSIIGGLIIGPIAGVALTLILAGALFNGGQWYLKTELDFRRLYVMVVLAHMPSQIIAIASPLIRPINLVCILLTSLLIYIGLTSNFAVDRKRSMRMIGTVCLLVSLYWVYGMLSENHASRIQVQEYTPESLDQLNKEMDQSKTNK